jgi:DNA-binding NtrC family response regulator
MNKGITAISEEFMTALVRHSWPGNVRELQTFIERSVLLSSGDVLSGSRPEVTNTLKLSTPVTLEEAESSLCMLPHGRVAAWRSRNRNRDVWIVNGNAEPHLQV